MGLCSCSVKNKRHRDFVHKHLSFSAYVKRCNLFSVKKGLIRETAHDFPRACATHTNLTGESLGGPGSVMVALLTLKQEVWSSNPGAAPPKKVWSPHLSLLPRLQVAKMLQGSPPPERDHGAGRMTSTRDYEKKNWEFHNISPRSCPRMAPPPVLRSVLPRCL